MKKALALLAIGMTMMMSCTNGATDGDPRTDTTSMPPDTNMNKDTVNHVNRNFGPTPTDTNMSADSMRR